VARIGSARAAYTTVLYPIVALAISTAFEGYTWHWTGALGLALALAGNLVMFAKPRALARPVRAAS
jgi:drug/metabolite transporter (DMT)-like permease